MRTGDLGFRIEDLWAKKPEIPQSFRNPELQTSTATLICTTSFSKALGGVPQHQQITGPARIKPTEPILTEVTQAERDPKPWMSSNPPDLGQSDSDVIGGFMFGVYGLVFVIDFQAGINAEFLLAGFCFPNRTLPACGC